MTIAPAVEECGHSSWTPIAPPAAYPYPDGLICCAFQDRPFEVMPEARCHQASAQALQWPKWEAEHGCVAPPDGTPERPICCLTMIDHQVTEVKQLPLHMCPNSDQTIPFSWCELHRCIEGPAAANYPDSSLGGIPGESNVQSAPASSRGSTVLFLAAGGALLLFIVVTCCYLSCMVTVRACFAPPGRRRAPLVGPPWQRDPLRQTRERAVAPSFRARLAAARRTAAAPAESQDGDSDAAEDRGTVYVVMPDQSFCIGEKAPSLTHSDTLKSPSGGVDDTAAAAPGITTAAEGSAPPASDVGAVSTAAPQHSIEVAQREGGVMWSGAPAASREWVGEQFSGMWPGAYETPVQNVWAVGVVGGHVRGVYPVEMGEPWMGVAAGGDVAWGAQGGVTTTGSHGVNIELPPLQSGLGDSDTVHDTTVHATSFPAETGSPFHCSVEEPQAELIHDIPPASDPDDEAGWSRDLYGEESQPVQLASRPSGGEWRFGDENERPSEPGSEETT